MSLQEVLVIAVVVTLLIVFAINVIVAWRDSNRKLRELEVIRKQYPLPGEPNYPSTRSRDDT